MGLEHLSSLQAVASMEGCWVLALLFALGRKMKVFIVVPSSVWSAASSLSCSLLVANRGVAFAHSLVITGFMSLGCSPPHQQGRHKCFSFVCPLSIVLGFWRNVYFALIGAFRQPLWGRLLWRAWEMVLLLSLVSELCLETMAGRITSFQPK